MAFRSLMSILTAVGLTTGLKHCSDAGSSSSYSGSGQTLSDLSGNSTDFNLGATSGSEGSDPTFAGSANGLTYADRFTLDGGDYFTLAASNPSWVDNLHKDNAKFTILIAVKFKASATTQRLYGTSGSTTTQRGITLFTASGTLTFRVGSGSASAVTPTATAPANDGYVVFAVSLDEAVGASGGFIFVNGVFTTFTSTYTSPASLAAAATLTLMSAGAASTPVLSGSEYFASAFWEGTALTQANISAIYNELGLRLGIAPEPRLFQPIENGLGSGVPSIEHGWI